MNFSTIGNPVLRNNVQTLVNGVITESFKKLSGRAASHNSIGCINKAVRLGEKTVIPFADDMFDIARYRFQQKSEVTEDKWLSAKKDFKRYCTSRGLSGKHAALRTPKKAGSTPFSLRRGSTAALVAFIHPISTFRLDDMGPGRSAPCSGPVPQRQFEDLRDRMPGPGVPPPPSTLASWWLAKGKESTGLFGAVGGFQQFPNNVRRSRLVFESDFAVLTLKRVFQSKLETSRMSVLKRVLKTASILSDKDVITKWTLTRGKGNRKK